MNKLRAIRNEKLGTGKLEFGCEVEYINNKYIFVEDDDVLQHRLYLPEKKKTLTKHRVLTKNLGKPVTLEEVLRMITAKLADDENFSIETSYKNGIHFHLQVRGDKSGRGCEFDITKSPEEQTQEVQDKLVSLIKGDE